MHNPSLRSSLKSKLRMLLETREFKSLLKNSAFLKSKWKTSTVVQQAKAPLDIPASHVEWPVRVLVASLSFHLPANELEEAENNGSSYLGFCHPCERWTWTSRLLSLALPLLDYCIYLRKKAVDKRYHFVYHSAFQINQYFLEKNLFKKCWRWLFNFSTTNEASRRCRFPNFGINRLTLTSVLCRNKWWD